MGASRKQIRILIADDHPLVRGALRRLLELEPGLTVAAEAADGVEAVQLTKDLTPDVLLLDVSMPRLSGMDVLRELAESGTPVKTVVFTGAVEPETAVEALRLGARGVVLKESSAAVLAKCIRAVASGKFWIGSGSVASLAQSVLRINSVRALAVRPPTITRIRRQR